MKRKAFLLSTIAAMFIMFGGCKESDQANVETQPVNNEFYKDLSETYGYPENPLPQEVIDRLNDLSNPIEESARPAAQPVSNATGQETPGVRAVKTFGKAGLWVIYKVLLASNGNRKELACNSVGFWTNTDLGGSLSQGDDFHIEIAEFYDSVDVADTEHYHYDPNGKVLVFDVAGGEWIIFWPVGAMRISNLRLED
ncbi:MAG: hypothetical protein LBE71_01890 [Dysgonamonadaceae bacterium]|jgi:hypothetical protein|nr:hypothetical protein [Dysgonamonadaceae bacterium]